MPCVAVNGGCITDPSTYTFRTMPKITTVAAKGIPPEGSGRFGYEVAHIKTTIT
jgi:hypothetical protein